jgi:hypothetical protein
MAKYSPLSPEAATHHKQVVAREVILLAAITLVALLLQAGGHQIPMLVLDGALISAGLVGLLAAVFLGIKGDRRSLVILSVVAIVAGLTQLLWSSGMAVTFLVLIAALPIGDALANIFILGRSIWLASRYGK